MTTKLSLLLAAILALGLTSGARAGYLENPDYPLSAVEKLYAELAKLSPADRQKALVAGAKKEAGVDFIQTLGGKLGRNNTKVFKKTYPFVKVREANLGTNYAMQRIVTEERAGKHITDVLGGDLTEAAQPLELGYLARYPTPATDAVLPQYRGFLDKHNRWIVYSWLEKGMSYNRDLIKVADAPKQWQDLCDPKYKGMFAVEPSRNRILIFLEKMLGRKKMEEFIKCMSENKPIIMRGATVRINLMLAGDHAIQGENSFYQGMTHVKKKGRDNSPFMMVLSAPIAGQPSCCVINRNANNPHTAGLLCDNLLSKQVQQFMFDNYRNPLTLPSPFIPTTATIIPLGPMPVAHTRELHNMWKKYMGSQKG